MFATWNFTVDSLMCGSCAITRLRWAPGEVGEDLQLTGAEVGQGVGGYRAGRGEGNRRRDRRTRARHRVHVEPAAKHIEA
ncbi:hypothetical protein ACIHCV_04775 [Streptomyces sp. NPDC051956]|uniref:hypothetical protein n=1 Tax=Streptomyces sp. NPDC051956 TaxID=3365677 RepID=UPI0037D08039